MTRDKTFAENPIVVRLTRGEQVESVHRGAWVVTRGSGQILRSAGDVHAPIFARSAVKCLQALPLIESGAAERAGYTDRELALALASHSGESQHTELAAGVLGRLGLDASHLQCGTGIPLDRSTRNALSLAGEEPCALHHNCSGKHAGFLALAHHLGVPVERYLDPESASQQLVREAVIDMAGLAPDELQVAIDGCSAPTFRMPLTGLARSFARFSSPAGLSSAGLSSERRTACERLLRAGLAHPELIAGEKGRLCTALMRASGGQLFAKIGAEAVYAVGHVGRDEALAVKMDDGGLRGVHALVIELLLDLNWIGADAYKELASFRVPVLHNAAGLEVGHCEVTLGESFSQGEPASV